MNRRKFCGALALTPLAGAISGCAGIGHRLGGGRKVAVIGGGFGGATAAGYLKKFLPHTEVTLIAENEAFHTCPFSNLVLGGIRRMDSIRHGYGNLAKQGVRVIHSRASRVDGKHGRVILADGAEIRFDRAVVSPGIDFHFDRMPGYSKADAERIPHSWKAGKQTEILRRQLEAMPDGGTAIILPPANPFRCPPGPYERASMMAHYFSVAKPRAKVLILDAKEKFSKQPLFTDGWNQLYGDSIEWRSAEAGGLVEAINPQTRIVQTEFGEEKGDVVNYIPPQRAGDVAINSGLADDSGWCPINTVTFESSQMPNVHVIGDSAIAAKMPKSGFSANSQGKIAAAAIAAVFAGREPLAGSFANTCYSFVAPDYAISVAAVYQSGGSGTIAPVKGAGGVSPRGADGNFRKREAEYAQGWYDSIIKDMFG